MPGLVRAGRHGAVAGRCAAMSQGVLLRLTPAQAAWLLSVVVAARPDDDGPARRRFEKIHRVLAHSLGMAAERDGARAGREGL